MNKLGFKELFTIGIGMIIGSGVITLTGFGIAKTGTGIFLAYILAGIAFMVCMLPTLIVGITVPRTSFSYTVSKELISPIAGGMFLMTFFIGRIIMSFFGIAFANYVDSILPEANKLGDFGHKAVAIGIITLFFVFNLLGVKSAAKVQKFFNILLIFSLVSFACLGLFKLEDGVFSSERFLPFGAGGLLSAVVLVMFPMGGGLTLLEFGGQVENPQKNLLKAVLSVTAVATVLFAVVGLAGSGVLPYEQVAGKPLTNAAETIYGFKAGTYLFVIGGALMAIVTTINSSFMWYCNTMIKGVEDGWFPKSLAKRNKYDSPYVLLIVFYLLGIVPILLGADMKFLSTVATGLALLFYLIPNFSLIGLPKKYPKEWEKSPFYIKNYFVVQLITIVCSAGFIGLTVYNFSNYSTVVLATIAGLFVLGFLYVLIRNKQIQKN